MSQFQKRRELEYVICLGGHVEPEWLDCPYKLEDYQAFNEEGQRAVTIIKTWLPDQPALHGLLRKIGDLNLKLIYLVSLSEAPEGFTDLFGEYF